MDRFQHLVLNMFSVAVDETGNVYGRLTVVGRSGTRLRGSRNSKLATWVCRCSCGNEVSVNGASLRSGNTESCGCAKRESGGLNSVKRSGKTVWQLAERALFTGYRSSAKARNIEFSISETFFNDLVSKDCYYCGKKPYSRHKLYKKKTQEILDPMSDVVYKANGIDRLDSRVGYVDGNCVPCCKACNLMKMRMSVDEFIKCVTAVSSHWFNFSLVEMATSQEARDSFIRKAA